MRVEVQLTTWLLPIVSSCTATDYFSAQNMLYRVREICKSDGLSSKFSETNEVALATHAFCAPGLYTNPNKKDSCNKCPVGKYNPRNLAKKVAKTA